MLEIENEINGTAFMVFRIGTYYDNENLNDFIIAQTI